MVITLCQDFAFVSATGQSFSFPWVSFPAEFKNAQIVVLAKSKSGGNFTVTVQTTWDTDSVATVGSVVTVSAVATQIQDVATGLGPMIRLNLGNSSGSDAFSIISVYVTPKSE